VRIFKNKWFTRFARKEAIGNDELRVLVNQFEEGQFDADLGGGVYKQRVARPGEGKSGGYRVIAFFRSGERTFFIGGFAKSDIANISQKALAEAKKQARTLFAMSEDQIKTALDAGILVYLRKFRGIIMDNKNMSEFLGSLHETAVGLHKIGVISDAEMREYDRNCIDREVETIPGGAGTTQKL
jgi:hypothetical protein